MVSSSERNGFACNNLEPSYVVVMFTLLMYISKTWNPLSKISLTGDCCLYLGKACLLITWVFHLLEPPKPAPRQGALPVTNSSDNAFENPFSKNAFGSSQASVSIGCYKLSITVCVPHRAIASSVNLACHRIVMIKDG